MPNTTSILGTQMCEDQRTEQMNKFKTDKLSWIELRDGKLKRLDAGSHSKNNTRKTIFKHLNQKAFPLSVILI